MSPVRPKLIDSFVGANLMPDDSKTTRPLTEPDDDDLEAWLDRLIDFVSRHPEFEGQPYGKAIMEAMAKEVS